MGWSLQMPRGTFEIHPCRWTNKEMNDLSPETISIFGREALGFVRPVEYVEWANHMLEKGFDTYNLCMLAGLEPLLNMFEVQSHFKRSLDELGIVRVSKLEDIRNYALYLIKGLANKTIHPDDALPILEKICVHSDYSSEYMIWYELNNARQDVESGHYPHMFPSVYGGNIVDVCSDEAQRYLNMEVQPPLSPSE
jgi:hypothetical protein